MTTAQISPAQVRFVRSLLSDKAAVLDLSPETIDAFVEAHDIERLTKGSASRLIDHLKALPSYAVGSAPEASNRPVNRYPGSCHECGINVPGGEGWRENLNGRWVVHHLPGDVRCVPAAEDSAPVPTRVDLRALLADVADGYYAYRSLTGSNDLDFVRVATSKGFYDPSTKGNRRLQRFVGGTTGNVEMSKPEQAKHASVLAVLTPAERTEAMLTFGREVGQCGRCGRSLTDEASRMRGVGPECASKV
jgi:hypothetical protein